MIGSDRVSLRVRGPDGLLRNDPRGEANHRDGSRNEVRLRGRCHPLKLFETALRILRGDYGDSLKRMLSELKQHDHWASAAGFPLRRPQLSRAYKYEKIIK